MPYAVAMFGNVIVDGSKSALMSNKKEMVEGTRKWKKKKESR